LVAGIVGLISVCLFVNLETSFGACILTHYVLYSPHSSHIMQSTYCGNHLGPSSWWGI
jgi:hypothetical protein